MPDYVHPEVLVSTDWVAEHLSDPQVRIVESDEDRALYTQGHLPGAVEIDWAVDLQCQVERDYIDRAAFEKLCAERAFPTTRPSSSTATKTTGGPATPSGYSSSTATRTAAS